MTPLAFTLVTLAISFSAGVLGSLLGLGGGIIVVPALTLLLKVDIRYAIGASVVSVTATSSGAAAAYVREHLTNLRVAMFLELGTTTGALTGAYLAGRVGGHWLYVLFGAVLGYSALAMLRRRAEVAGEVPPDPLADRLRLHSAYADHVGGERVAYRVTGTRTGLGLMFVAGTVSGMLGIGSGALKVPAMDLAMRLPIKVSTATSNFMIGVTAAASAGVYFARGDIDPFVAAPVAIGVLLGALTGSRLLGRLKNRALRGLAERRAETALVLATRHEPLPGFLGAALGSTVHSAVARAAGDRCRSCPRGRCSAQRNASPRSSTKYDGVPRVVTWRSSTERPSKSSVDPARRLTSGSRSTP